MIKDALKSMKNDLSGSVFYWLTFVLSSMFILLYFHLSYSDTVGVSFINSENNMKTFMSVIVIALCMIVIFFTNDFYVKKKAKELSVRLVCGSTYASLVIFLLFQTLFLFILAVPVGMLLAVMGMPFINYLLCDIMKSDFHIVLNADAFVSTFVIIAVEIGWCTFVNLGFSYRCSIKNLMDGDKGYFNSSFRFPVFFSGKTKKVLSLVGYLLPVVLFYTVGKETTGIFILSLIGMIGMYNCFEGVFVPYLSDKVENNYIEDPVSVVSLGFLRHDCKILKSNVVLLVVSDIILIGILVSCLNNSVDIMMSMISFVVINVLLTFALMFKFSSELMYRRPIFESLRKIGYLDSQVKKIMTSEIVLLYVFTAVLCLLYIVNIFVVLMIHSLLDLRLIVGMVVAFVVPLFVCGIMNYTYYKKVVLGG